MARSVRELPAACTRHVAAWHGKFGMDEGEGTIRPARIDEPALLTELTFRAVAHWGYDETFMARAREAVRVQPEHHDQGLGFVLDEATGVAGFYVLRHDPPKSTCSTSWLNRT